MGKQPEEIKSVYVVTSNGYDCGFGQMIYLLGVFVDESRAREIAQDEGGEVTEAPFDVLLRTRDDGCNRSNAYYLGGYVE